MRRGNPDAASSRSQEGEVAGLPLVGIGLGMPA